MPIYRVPKGTSCLKRAGKSNARVWNPHVLPFDVVTHRGHYDGKEKVWVLRFKGGYFKFPADKVRGAADRSGRKSAGTFHEAPYDPLQAAAARAMREDRPVQYQGPQVAPGSGTDEWREND